MISCIYKIINVINNNYYIGSTVDFKNRKRQHLWELNNNIHDNKHLQASFNKYGKEAFSFEIIECVLDINKLIEREQYYIDSLKPQYNIRKIAESNFGYRHSEESKKKMSLAHKGLHCGENNGMYGKTGKDNPRFGVLLSKETKNKISNSNKGKNLKKSVSKIGDRNPIYGKLGDKNHSSKAVVQLSLSGEFITEYSGQAEAARITNKGGKPTPLGVGWIA